MRYRTPISIRLRPPEKRLGTFRFLAILPLYSNCTATRFQSFFATESKFLRTTSPGGLIARPNDAIDCAFHFGTDSMVEEVMAEIGAVVLGNRGFREGTMQISRFPYGGMLKVPHFVVTHKARELLTIRGVIFTFLAGGLEHTITAERRGGGSQKGQPLRRKH